MLSLLEKAFLGGYASSDLDITTMFLCVGCTAVIALCICLVYKMVNKNSFFDRRLCPASRASVRPHDPGGQVGRGHAQTPEGRSAA